MAIAFGMGAMGALLGVWIALSKSAVVLAVVPLLFGAIGGGYSLLKMDLAKPGNREKVRIAGIGLGSLCLGCLVLMVATIVSRPAIDRLMNGSGYDVSRSDAPVASLALRARLQALGASDAEIRNILEAKPGGAVDIVALMPGVLSAAGAYVAAYDALPAADRAVLDDRKISDDSRTIYLASRMFVLEHRALSQGGKPAAAQMASLLARTVPDLSTPLRVTGSAAAVQEVFLKNEDFAVARAKLAVAANEAQLLATRDAAAQVEKLKVIDATLRVLASAKGVSSSSLLRSEIASSITDRQFQYAPLAYDDRLVAPFGRGRDDNPS